jgi:8-amino-7-oxononanoate synthase
MLQKLNYHVHTNWSFDSKMSLREALVAASDLGFSEIAITDHVDFNTPYLDDVVSDIAGCHAEIDALAPEFPRLIVRKGVEVGLHRDCLAETDGYLAKLDPDFVIASVHSFRCNGEWNREAAETMALADYARLYYEELLYVMERFERWNVLGHLDFPMRYHPITEEDLLSCRDVIDTLLQLAISRGRGIEINLAGVGKIGRCHPAPWILRRYFELGGTILTLGTDAHATDELTRGWEAAEALLAELGNPQLSTFAKMRPVGARRSDDHYAKFCEGLKEATRFRSLRESVVVSAREVEIDGKRLLNFSSNNYLGLSFHPGVIQRSREYLERYGVGSTASRLVCGNSALQGAIEAKLARAKGSETALLFQSGFQANLSVLGALFDRHVLGTTPLVFSDRLNHASLHAGCAQAGVRQLRYPHNDLNALETLLKKHENSVAPRFIVTESVFSMDGDIVDIEALAYLAQKYGATLFLDEAHATGVLGERGFGLAPQIGGRAPWISLGTCSKALGGSGAYVACSKTIRDFLVNRASGLIYSTALPPPVLGAIDAAIDHVPSLEEERKRLLGLSSVLRERLRASGFEVLGGGTPIVPVVVCENSRAMSLSDKLIDSGMFGIAIRPPTVPEGMARLRLSLTAAHTEEDVSRLVECLDRFG